MIIRHGESEANCDKTINCRKPNHKVELTSKGYEQAVDSGLKLRELVKEGEKICFYTSPFLRTRQTLEGIIKGFKYQGGEIACDNDYVVYEEPLMREQNFGNFQLPNEEMRKIWIERSKYGHFFYRLPNGESGADVYDRCSSFIETLWRQFQKKKFPEVLVLVSHGLWIRVFLQKWFGWSIEHFESLCNVPHSSWIALRLSPNGIAGGLEDESSYRLEGSLRQSKKRKRKLKNAIQDTKDGRKRVSG